MSQDETIDLQKLTQKELLIRLWDKVNTVTQDLADIKRQEEKKSDSQMQLMLDFARLETKVKVWGAVFGIGTALVMELITTILK
jgi:hypothetical protein